MQTARSGDSLRGPLALMLLGVLGVRVYYRWRAVSVTEPVERRERRRETLVRGVAGLAGLSMCPEVRHASSPGFSSRTAEIDVKSVPDFRPCV